MATKIDDTYTDPRDWPMQLRLVARRLGLDCRRIDFHGVLMIACNNVVEAAQDQGRTVDAVRAAIDWIGSL